MWKNDIVALNKNAIVWVGFALSKLRSQYLQGLAVAGVIAFCASPSYAEEIVTSMVSSSTVSSPTVEENMQQLDSNHDGIVTAQEIREHIQSIHGKDYEQATLDKWVKSMDGASCGTPFAKRLY